MSKTLRWLIPLIAVLVVIAAVLFFWLQREEAPPKPPPVEPPRAEAPPPALPPQPAEPPPPQHPIGEAQPAAPPQEAEPPPPLPPLAASDKTVQDTLLALVGRDSVLKFLNVSDYIRRFVVTVDNLPRKRAPVRFWPINPTPGRFIVTESGNVTTLSADNFKRYEPFVRLVESVDTAKAVALYVRFYPLIQEAYEELGSPNKHFNDRLIEVIDHLLATPDLGFAAPLTLPRVGGSIKLDRPWVLYEFANPDLEQRSAGQKIMLRVGIDNATRLKAKLRDLRSKLVRGAPKK